MNVNKTICAIALGTYGKEYMLNVCMEEPSELIQAISKYRREGTEWLNNVAEEMADVYITLQETAMICGIPDEDIEDWIARKQDRTLTRALGKNINDDARAIKGADDPDGATKGSKSEEFDNLPF